MGNKINLNEDIVIKEYLSGKSSLILAKEFNVSKPVILKILKKNNVTRKRDRCKSLKIERVGEKYITKRICPNCKKEIDVVTTRPTTTCRNYFKMVKDKSVCKKCLGNVMTGEGNPFFGKKHSDKTKEQISKSRIGKATGEKNSMANPEHREKARQCVIEWIKKTPIKYYNRSKKEKEIYSFLKTKFKKTKHSFVVDKFICDIYIPELNLMIEYNGDYWHCNPKKYDKEYYHKIKNKTAGKIWEYDSNKIDLIKNYGYNLEIVWETDYEKNPKIIEEILKKYE
jgi:G:T-mismatch repair DNA endonuclease (very short patch repair protein)